MVTADNILTLLDAIVNGFGNIWEFLNTPIYTLLLNSDFGIIVAPLVATLPIAKMSVLVLMFGAGLTVFIGYQLITWILNLVT